MELKDIKPGMVVVTRDGEYRIMVGDRFYRVSDYEHYIDVYSYSSFMNDANGNSKFDIMKVYKDSRCLYISTIPPIWNRETYVDWYKIPNDTLIEVSNYDDFRKSVLRYFRGINEDGKIECWKDGCTSFTTNESVSWDYARLLNCDASLNQSKVEEEAIIKGFNDYCDHIDCADCKYYPSSVACELLWVVDNFNMSKKEG